jgi:hypothetical protein
VDSLSVADVDTPERKMRADAAAFTQKRGQKQGAATMRARTALQRRT